MSQASFTDLDIAGKDLYNKGEFAAAAQQFQQMVEMNPTVATTWRSLGLAHYAASNFEEAHKAFKAAVNLDSQDVDSTFGLANVAAAQGLHDDAISYYDATLNLKPNHAAARQALIAALTFRGKEHLAAGNTVRAESDLERAYKMERRNPELAKVLAKHFIDTGQKGKVAKLAEYTSQDLPGDEVTLKLQEFIATSPDYASYRVQQVAHGTSVQQPQRPQAQQIPCPNCHTMVMEWAAVCPACNHQIKAVMSQFAGRGPKTTTTWQEVAYYILAGIWCANGAWLVIQASMFGDSPLIKGFSQFVMALGAINIGIGICLFLQMEWVQFIAKVLSLLMLFVSLRSFTFAMALTDVGGGIYWFVSAVIFGLNIYILKHQADV